MTMALSRCGSSPAAFMRLNVSRQERPASTRMLAVELENTVQLPPLPLAKTVIRTGTEGQHNRIPEMQEGEIEVRGLPLSLPAILPLKWPRVPGMNGFGWGPSGK